VANTDWLSVLQNPDVVKVSRGRGRRRYGKGVPHLLGLAEFRISQAVADGVEAYRRRSRRSARRRKDGALRDFARNIAAAQDKVVTRMAKLPRDLTGTREFTRLNKSMRKPMGLLSF